MARGLRKSFGNTTAVAGVDLTVKGSEICSLVGPSGCGKTTTLRLIAGLETPDEGTVELGGHEAAGTPPHRRGVGLVFQDYALFPHMTVAENIAFGLNGESKATRGHRIAEILALIDMEGMADRMPAGLSGGQQQRVALGRALAPNPKLILLDEPLSNLDPQLRRRVRHEVAAMIRATSTAAVWVTHDMDEGLIVADKVAVMNDGRIVQYGEPSEIWHRPSEGWVASFTGYGDLLEGVVKDGKLMTNLGEVVATGLSEGAKAHALIKPEDVVMKSDGAPGVVVRRHFSGTDNIYCVELDSGSLLHSKQDGDIPRGTKVRLGLAHDELPVYPV